MTLEQALFSFHDTAFWRDDRARESPHSTERDERDRLGGLTIPAIRETTSSTCEGEKRTAKRVNVFSSSTELPLSRGRMRRVYRRRGGVFLEKRAPGNKDEAHRHYRSFMCLLRCLRDQKAAAEEEERQRLRRHVVALSYGDRMCGEKRRECLHPP